MPKAETKSLPPWLVIVATPDGPMTRMVKARTKGEARAAAKLELGLGKRGRLPAGTRVERQDA